MTNEYNTKDELFLPSTHQIGDRVWVVLSTVCFVGRVKAVHFYEGKIKYDVDVFDNDGEVTTLSNLDSLIVDYVNGSDLN